MKWLFFLLLPSLLCFAEESSQEGLPLFYWAEKWHGRTFVNFGDYLSLKIVERIVGKPIRVYQKGGIAERKMLAIGSIFSFAKENDVIWGTGINGKLLEKKYYRFTHLDVRSVRGPLTRRFLMEHFNIVCPEIYGDPALLIPYLFPEFKRKENPAYDYIVIPHFSEEHLFPKSEIDNIVYSTEPWEEVMDKILDSKLVISSSLHGVIVAEAFGIPARLLRMQDDNEESIFKYCDYYSGTKRPDFQYATSIEEALEMGGMPPFECDLEKLYNAFPFDLWPNTTFNTLKLRKTYE